MTTTCPTCRALVVRRVWLTDAPAEPLFAETYACGAVRLYGRIEGDGTARSCPSTCARCSGGGWVETYHGDGSVNRRERCPVCEERRRARGEES